MGKKAEGGAFLNLLGVQVIIQATLLVAMAAWGAVSITLSHLVAAVFLGELAVGGVNDCPVPQGKHQCKVMSFWMLLSERLAIFHC